MGKDYYKILGIEKAASQDEVKTAFRKLAHKYHPDKQTGDEAKFKEVNEAYQVLGKADKREQYDQFGSDFEQQGGFGGGMGWEDFMNQARSGGGGGGFSNMNFGGIDLGDIFGDMFGFGGGRGSKRNRGQDIQMDMKISFKEAAFGVKHDVELYKGVNCGHCHGNMAEPGTPINTCKDCNGQGKTARVQRTMLGNFQTVAECQACHGEGKIPEKKCTKCSGTGVQKQNEKIEYEVPAGIESGSTIRLTGMGEAAAHGGQSGDLYVRVFVDSDKRFERHGADILYKLNTSFVQAALGDKIDVETLDGAVELKIPPGTQPGTRMRLKGKGMTRLHRKDRGDMYVEVNVEVPKKLSRKQKKLLEDFEK
jgi:molecular chaperone DnaJ